MNTFLAGFRADILDKFRSYRAFVREAQPKDDEASMQSYLMRVLKGEKPPNLVKVEGWADALGLVGAARQEFLDKCAILHLPPEAQPRFFAMLRSFHHGNPRLDAHVDARVDARVKAKIAALEKRLQ